MSDLHQAQQEVTRLRRRLREVSRERDLALEQARTAQRELGEWRLSTGAFSTSYVSATASLVEVAYGGIRRPDDLGGSITGTSAKSRPPAHDHVAYRRLRAEVEHQRYRARVVETWVRRHADADTDPSDSTPLAGVLRNRDDPRNHAA